MSTKVRTRTELLKGAQQCRENMVKRQAYFDEVKAFLEAINPEEWLVIQADDELLQCIKSIT